MYLVTFFNSIIFTPKIHPLFQNASHYPPTFECLYANVTPALLLGHVWPVLKQISAGASAGPYSSTLLCHTVSAALDILT